MENNTTKRQIAVDELKGPAEEKVKNIKGRKSYGSRFLAKQNIVKRGEKSIYLRKEYHDRLLRIVQVIGEDKIPLYAYLDNILEHHFEQFEKAIKEDFNKHNKPIF
ncbi:DUF3408 domain-containing protein [Chryseobacterium polytrichastri]|uniref:DUF3408 domain-containing protein n=1 Tax=Chryseobacterium polytrichastri TaxID=1302687 RepID=A0A1M7DI62_9FLAO|nr:DUF3408 domain-containing protein [Chryseobacterium polytrichastri]SHL79211.1 Protein of unknown function [Chryseobacterium polytrichastri]